MSSLSHSCEPFLCSGSLFSHKCVAKMRPLLFTRAVTKAIDFEANKEKIHFQKAFANLIAKSNNYIIDFFNFPVLIGNVLQN